MYKVYVWTNAINGKRYVGITGTSMEKRAGLNGYHYHGSPHFYSAILKYGFENFSYVILEDNLTKAEAAEKEKYYIQKFNTMNPAVGYNLQVGGFPEEIPESNIERAKKISATLKEQRSSPEYREIMRNRARAVWDDPERHAEILEKRKGKAHGGTPQVAIYCEETELVYSSQAKASLALGFHRSTVSSALTGGKGKAVLKHRNGTQYHIYRVKGER